MSEISFRVLYPRLGYLSFTLLFLFMIFDIWNRLIYHASGTIESHLQY